MFTLDDTIVAVATPPGRGGIGVVRLSGPDALAIAGRLIRRTEPLEARHATFTRVHGAGGVSDQAVVTFFPAPHSYTGGDVVEISAHGSDVLLRAIVTAAIGQSARLAEPGEFTLRAFVNGRIDLVQAEAVRDLIESVTPAQARAAFDQLEGTLTARIQEIDRALLDLSARFEASLDFPEEGYHFVEPSAASAELMDLTGRIDVLLADAGQGRLIREGAQVAIAGCPNAGKSSLFNQLAGAARAIVTDVPGTTRDLVSERIDLEGIPVTLIDTAGIRALPGDAIEAEGIDRAQGAMRVAGAVVVVLDRSRAMDDGDRQLLLSTAGAPRVIAANKRDLNAAWTMSDCGGTPIVDVSALTGEGLADLREAIVGVLSRGEDRRDRPAVTNVRHAALLGRARTSLARAAAAAASSTPEEFVVVDIHEARAALEEITGTRTADDVLRVIFEKFCIGK